MGQSRGWLASRNSITPSRALCVRGELVLTTIPGWTGHAHDATGFGALSTSTKHIRQFPAIMSFLLWGSVIVRFGFVARLTHDSSIWKHISKLYTIFAMQSSPRYGHSRLLASLNQCRTSCGVCQNLPRLIMSIPNTFYRDLLAIWSTG
jgi:hypothetical protein